MRARTSAWATGGRWGVSPVRPCLLSLVALSLLPFAAQSDPVTEAPQRLFATGGFRIELSGVFEKDGAQFAGMNIEGTFLSLTQYRLDAISRVIDHERPLRVVRIGERQWQWVSDEQGWCVATPGSDPVSQSVLSLLLALEAAQRVEEREQGEFEGVACGHYDFTLPPGVASLQGLAVEGTGEAWIGLGDGLPREVSFLLATPIGASGRVTIRLGSFGEDPGLAPPGLGGGFPGEPEVTGAALIEAMAGAEVVHVTLQAVAEGASSGSTLLGKAEPLKLEVYVLPSQNRAWASLMSGDQRVGEMVADGAVVWEYFRDSAVSSEPDWSLSNVDPTSPQAAWRLHTQVIEEVIGDRALRRTGVVERAGLRLIRYEFSPDPTRPAGLLVPTVMESLVASEAQIAGTVLVLEPSGRPDSIEVTLVGRTQEGGVVSVQESYVFAYSLTDAERTELESVFEAARQRSVVDPRLLGDEDSVSNAERMVLAIARECPTVLDNQPALEAKLRRAERIPSAIGAWVLDGGGAPLAAWGEADLPATVPEAKELQPGVALQVPVDAGLIVVAPYEGRTNQPGGVVVLLLAPKQARLRGTE